MHASPLSSLQIPIVETERLRLRGHHHGDFEHSCTLWADPQVAEYTVGQPQTREEVWSRMLRYLGLWSLLGFGYWVVEERSTGSFLGEVGLCNFRRDLKPPLEDVPEIGWSLLPAYHGRGYATEAAQAVLQWAATSSLEAKRIACILHTGNRASRRVADKCGFEPKYVTTYRGFPTLVLYSELHRLQATRAQD